MPLTSIGAQLTPGTPTEITFAAQTGLPSTAKTVIIIGHQDVGSASGQAYVPKPISNVADVKACSGEITPLFGANSELTKMILAFVTSLQSGSVFPQITAMPLLSTDADWGQALTAIDRIPGDYLVACYDGNNATLMNLALTQASNMSQASRVMNAQYGTTLIAANQSVGHSAAASLTKYDKQNGDFCFLPDTAPTVLIGELAAAYAAQVAANAVPYLPLNGVVVPNAPTPAAITDWITVGAGMESEAILNQGWTPLKVLPNGSVAIVRSRTLRVTTDGVTLVTAYFDQQDFDVLYYWRKTLVTRFNQPDFQRAKASVEVEKLLLAECIRLAQAFQDQGMFQAVDLLAKQFQVQRNASDRSRFDVFTPVNVIPGLAVIAANVQATTVGDTVTV